MALVEKKGYGQVEPNHLSAQRTAQIYAQLPCAAEVEVLENGSFLSYNYQAGICDKQAEAKGSEYMLVFNEVKSYDPAHQGYKDFAVKKSEMVDGVITPRLFKINDGDIFTTNLVDFASEAGGRKGKFLVPAVNPTMKAAVLTQKDEPANGDMVFVVVAETTMPDGQYAVKVQKVRTQHDVADA